MGLSLKKLWDQANVFDNGKSYKTQETALDRSMKVQQAQRANLNRVVQQNPSSLAARKIASKRNQWDVDIARPSTFNAFRDAAAQVGNNLDFNANSSYDRQQRLMAGQPELYRDQQLAMGNKRPFNNAGQAFVGNSARFLNTAAAARREVEDTAKMYMAQATDNPEAYANAVRRNELFKQTAYQPDSGLLGAGTIFDNPEEFNTLGAGEITKRIGSTTIGTAGDIIPVGKGLKLATLGGGVSKGAASKLVGQGALASGMANVGEQYLQYGKVDPKQVAASAVIGGVTTGGIGVAGAKIAPTVKQGAEAAKPVVKAAKETTKTVIDSQIDAPGAYRKALANESVAEARMSATFQKLGDAKAKGRGTKVLEAQLDKDRAAYLKAKAIRKAAEINKTKPGLSIEKQPAPQVGKTAMPDFNERQAAALAEKEAQILKPRGVEELRAKGRRVSSKLYNPSSEAERINQRNAKAMGKSVKTLNASEDLTHKMDVVQNSRVIANELIQETGLDKVIQKHKPGDEATKEFIRYVAAKRDISINASKGKRIFGGESLDEVKKFVKAYEAKNKGATTDIDVIKKHFKTLLDAELRAEKITPEFYKNALKSEDYYAPVMRVLGSEDVLRPSVNVNNKASLSKTSATTKLKGGDNPIKADWDAVLGSTEKRIRENKLNEAYRVLYDIADDKRIDDAVRMGMNKQQSKALIDVQNSIARLRAEAADALKSAKTSNKQVKIASKKMTAYSNKVNDKAVERIAKSMEAVDPDSAAAIRGLKRSDRNQLGEWLQGKMTDAEISNGIKKSAQLQDAVARLQDAQARAAGLQDDGRILSAVNSELKTSTDSTGRQVIRGFVDGYPTWVEVTPDIAQMVQGLEPQKLPGIIKGLASVQRVWRTFWTGLFNPVFSAKSFLFYDPGVSLLNQSGSRQQFNPKVAVTALGDAFRDSDGFFKELKKAGVQPVYGSRMSGDVRVDADIIASHKDFQSRLTYLATHPGQLLDALDVFGGKLAHSTRMRTARAEYAKSIANKLSEADALENAARAYNNILPNYARTARLMKEIDAIIPYANAGVAGNRSMTSAMRVDPVGWSAKAALFATAAAAVGEYSLGSDETREFYQDMYDSGKVSTLQNNIVFALPGAKKDPETGEWTGIVKLPIPPEFRAPNAILQDAIAENDVDKGNYDPTLAATTSLATAGITNIGREGGVNVEYNPAAQAILELSTNKKGGTGDSFAYGDNQYLPRNEQVNDNTSQLAISGAQAFNKLPFGDISPAALDEQLKGLGMGGNIIRSVGSGLTKNPTTTEEQLPSTDLIKSIKGLVSADGTKGMTDAKWHFKHQDQVLNTLPTKTYRDQFSVLNSKNDSPGDAQSKSQLLYESLQSDGVLWEAQKKQNDLDAAKTGISNPIFSLTPAQARAVTLYRGNSRLTAAKQTYAKDGSSLFQSLGLDEKWYQDFKNKEADFYDAISKKTDDNSKSVSTSAKTYSGNAPAKPSPVIQSKLDTYYTLPKGTGARTAFLKENPDVVQYWNQQNALTNEERLAMGLDLLGDGSTSSGYGSGGGGSSASTNYMKYALDLNAGGNPKMPTGKAGKAVKVGVKRKDATAKPKVSIKKSLV